MTTVQTNPGHKPQIKPRRGQNPQIAPVEVREKTPRTVTFQLVVQLEDVRPIVVFKSHSDPLSLETYELLSHLAPSGVEGTGDPLIDDAIEVNLLISKETTKGQSLSKQDKIIAEVEDRANLRERVYNAIAYHIRQTPQVFYANWRPILIPYGDPRTTLAVAEQLRGIYSEHPMILNLINSGGNRVPHPTEPLIDLDRYYHSGRKLRDLRDRMMGQSSLATQARETVV